MFGLQLLDLLLIIVHFVIIGFNLSGWIWKRTRKAHLMVICATASCWFILGIWFGIGYCPITDWDWQIKEQLGIHNLPDSFIKYYADILVGHSVDADLINTLTATAFFLAAALSVYFNFFHKRKLSKTQ